MLNRQQVFTASKMGIFLSHPLRVKFPGLEDCSLALVLPVTLLGSRVGGFYVCVAKAGVPLSQGWSESGPFQPALQKEVWSVPQWRMALEGKIKPTDT